MHSSRMRTVRCSGSLLPRTPPATRPLPCMPPTMQPPPATHAPLHHARPPWTEFVTHACENITFPQLLLRTVKISLSTDYCFVDMGVQS